MVLSLLGRIKATCNGSREVGDKTNGLGSVATPRNSEKHEYCGCAVFAKVKGGWPVAISIRNILPILVAVLKHCKTFQNGFPDHF